MQELLQTCWKDVNRRVNGLYLGEVTLLLSSPCGERTNFALNLINHLSLTMGQGCLFFAQRLPRDNVISCLAKIRGEDEQATAQTIAGSSLVIDESVGIDVAGIERKCREAQKRAPLRWIVVEEFYALGLSKPRIEKYQWLNRKETDERLTALKALAQKLNVAVLVLGSLIRSYFGKRASAAHRRHINTRSCDSVWVLDRGITHTSRPELYRLGNGELTYFTVVKCPRGGEGRIKLLFDCQTTRITDL